jgi:hypothetical protein
MAATLRVGHFTDPKQVCDYVNTNNITQSDIEVSLTRYEPRTSTTFMYFWWDPAGHGGTQPPACPGIKDASHP